MPSSLVTEWKRVAQSGPTMDGRIIKPEWLTDMAETYDPDVYTAKIWLDHMRYASYGSVRELKAEEDGDVIRLFAKIAPSRGLLQMNEVWEEKLHFSIEPIEDFAKTGKCYLGGLGMTDSPASLGTDEMRFSKMPGREFSARYAGEKVPDLREMEDEKEIERFGQKLFRFFSINNKPKEEEEAMNEKQFGVLTDSLTNLQSTLVGFSEKLEKFSAGQPGKEATTPEQDKPEPSEDENKFAGMQTEIKTLTEKFDALLDRIEKVAPGTEFKETTAPAGDDAELL
ncbi:MAG: GPO family capsid scaffolding protein [Desulforhopalus sp.]